MAGCLFNKHFHPSSIAVVQITAKYDGVVRLLTQLRGVENDFRRGGQFTSDAAFIAARTIERLIKRNMSLGVNAYGARHQRLKVRRGVPLLDTGAMLNATQSLRLSGHGRAAVVNLTPHAVIQQFGKRIGAGKLMHIPELGWRIGPVYVPPRPFFPLSSPRRANIPPDWMEIINGAVRIAAVRHIKRRLPAAVVA